MRHRSRLDGLWGKLSAKERGIALLRAFKAGEEEDPMLRRKMPPEQIPDFNRYILLLQRVNQGLGVLVMRYPPIIQVIRLRLAVMALSELWKLRADASFGYVALHCGEPIIESAYRELQEEATRESLPLDEAAQLLAEEYEGWESEDLEEGMPTESAWERIFTERRRELEELVKRGELEGEETEDDLLINVGSFYGWKGEPVPVIPQWGMEYDIRPDQELEKVEERRKRLEQVWEFRRQMARLWGEMEGDERSEDLAEHIRDDIQVLWQEVQALKAVLKEVAENFSGEDPALPELRRILDDTGGELEKLRPLAETYAGPFELPEPSQEMVEELRGAMESLQKLS